MTIYIEWLDWARAYRLYNADDPENTIAWEENIYAAEDRARAEGGEDIILCDADTM